MIVPAGSWHWPTPPPAIPELGLHQTEVAAHEAARPLQIGEHLAAIMGDGVH